MRSVQSPNDWYRDWRTWNLEDECRSSKLQHCWDRQEYWEESWKLVKTRRHSDSSEKRSSNAGVSNSQNNHNNNDSNFFYGLSWLQNAYDMVPQTSILHCLKMYRIPNQVVLPIEKTVQTWRVELAAGGKSLAEITIQSGIFQGDALSPTLFLIGTMPLNHILRKCTAEYKLSKSQEKINHMM